MVLLLTFYQIIFMISISTPKNIEENIRKLEFILVQDKDEDFLNKYIQDYTRLFNGMPLYVAKVSGKSQPRNHYQCTFATATGCPSQISVSKIFNCFRITNRSNFIHNHELDSILDKRIRNTISNEIKDKIKNDTENGLETSQIRLKNGFSGCSQVIYNIRRKFLGERSQNDVIDSLNTIDNWKGWNSVYLRDEEMMIRYIMGYNTEILSEKYSGAVHIIDDTVDTNIYVLALMVSLIPDPNAVYQVAGFAFIDNKSVEAYEMFFRYLKKTMGGREVDLFLTDRSSAQRRGFLNVYPNVDYIYCKRHILTNLKQNLGSSKIYKKINYLYQTKAESEVIVSKLIESSIKINNSKNKVIVETTIKKIISQPLKLKRIEKENNTLHLRIQIMGDTIPITTFAKNLIDEKTHWMPEYVDKKMSYGIRYTNAIEGFFGNLKTLLGNKKRLLIDVVTSIKLLSDRRIMKSRNIKRYKISKKIITEEDQQKIGNVALKIIKTEYEELKKGDIEDCNDCAVKIQFGLVCRHQLKDIHSTEPMLGIDRINGNFLLRNKQGLSTQAEILPTIQTKKNSYSYYISRLSDIVSSSQSDKKLQAELDEFLEKCESRKKEIGNSGIKTYKTPGVKMKSRRKVDISVGISKKKSKKGK